MVSFDSAYYHQEGQQGKPAMCSNIMRTTLRHRHETLNACLRSYKSKKVNKTTTKSSKSILVEFHVQLLLKMSPLYLHRHVSRARNVEENVLFHCHMKLISLPEELSASRAHCYHQAPFGRNWSGSHRLSNSYWVIIVVCSHQRTSGSLKQSYLYFFLFMPRE